MSDNVDDIINKAICRYSSLVLHCRENDVIFENLLQIYEQLMIYYKNENIFFLKIIYPVIYHPLKIREFTFESNKCHHHLLIDDNITLDKCINQINKIIYMNELKILYIIINKPYNERNLPKNMMKMILGFIIN